MVNKSKYLLFSCILLFNYISFSQEEQILQKKQELSQLKDEITTLQSELSSKSKKEKETFATVENYNKQSFLLNKLITSLQKEERIKNKEIKKINNSINTIEDDIKLLKENYAIYVVAIYKKGKYNELEAILDAESLQQAIYRVQYLKKFSDSREKDLEKYKEKKEQLIILQTTLEKEKKEKAELVLLKKNEDNQLQTKLNERKKILKAIKNDKTEIQKSLNAKREAQDKIENLIAQLVEEVARRNREEELRKQQILASGNNINSEESGIVEENNTGYEYDLNTSSFESFSELKGKMIWPLQNGKIIRKFGESKNKQLNTITLNYGIDIEAAKDLNVKSVGEGIVSAIEWVPGYGSVVIISHNGDYRTVYSHLAEIFVNEGDQVKAGSLLAIVGESLEGKVLHFEIWKARDKQNPELWLAKR